MPLEKVRFIGGSKMAKKRKRTYRVFKDSPAPIEISLEDHATGYMVWVRANYPNAIRWSLKSLGNEIRKKVKQGIKSKAPGGEPWQHPFMPARKRANFEKGEKTRFSPFGQLRNSIGYQYNEKNGGTVEIGWLSDSGVELGSKLVKGFRTIITEKMRRKYAAAGIFLGSHRREISSPARPVFEPIMKKMSPEIAPYITKKLKQYEENGWEKSW